MVHSCESQRPTKKERKRLLYLFDRSLISLMGSWPAPGRMCLYGKQNKRRLIRLPAQTKHNPLWPLYCIPLSTLKRRENKKVRKV